MSEPSNLPFPLIRKFSAPITPLLLRTPLSANQVTSLSLLFGFACAGLYAMGEPSLEIPAAISFFGCYLLDNCDGEVARHKGQCSEFGAFYDSFVDWLVHTAFFLGLGIGTAIMDDDWLWLWLGIAAGAGGTVNYFLGRYLEAKDESETKIEAPLSLPETWPQWLLFGFRELARADFCFIVLFLAVFQSTWLLLPAAAIGAQIYWLGQFSRIARRFHV